MRVRASHRKVKIDGSTTPYSCHGLHTDMNKTDVNVLAAGVAACRKGKKGLEILKRIQSRAHVGCGRQTVRIVDK